MKIGIAVMRCQPPHKGHIKALNVLRSISDRTILFMTGNVPNEKNPFSFELRKKIVENSIGFKSLMPVEIYKADTGHIYSLIKNTGINVLDCSIVIVVGNDRFASFKKQVDESISRGELPEETKIFRISDVKKGDRISGTRIRKLIVSNAKSAVRSMMSPHLSNFDRIYNELRNEIKPHISTIDSLKSIPHLNKISDEEFLYWLNKINKLEDIEISEKLDGSAQLSFGIYNNRLYTSPKTNRICFSADEYERENHKRAHNVLKKLENRLIRLRFIDATGSIKYPQFFVEILYTKIPNSIEYGKNMLVFYKVSIDGNKVEGEIEDALITEVLNLIGKSKTIDGEKWYFDRKPIIDGNIIKKIDLGFDLQVYKRGDDNIKYIKDLVYSNIQRVVESLKPAFGPKKSFVEGIVFRDKKTGEMVKVTNPVFPLVQKYFWYYRNLLEGGIKGEDGRFELGIEDRLYRKFSKYCGVKSLFNKNIGTNFISKRIASYSLPDEGKCYNSRLNDCIGEFIKKEEVFRDHNAEEALIFSIGLLKEALDSCINLNEQWEQAKNSKYLTISEDKKIIYPEIIVGRTDKEFTEKINRYLDMIKKLVRIYNSELSDEVKKIGLLKVFINVRRIVLR